MSTPRQAAHLPLRQPAGDAGGGEALIPAAILRQGSRHQQEPLLQHKALISLPAAQPALRRSRGQRGDSRSRRQRQGGLCAKSRRLGIPAGFPHAAPGERVREPHGGGKCHSCCSRPAALPQLGACTGKSPSRASSRGHRYQGAEAFLNTNQPKVTALGLGAPQLSDTPAASAKLSFAFSAGWKEPRGAPRMGHGESWLCFVPVA